MRTQEKPSVMHLAQQRYWAKLLKLVVQIAYFREICHLWRAPDRCTLAAEPDVETYVIVWDRTRSYERYPRQQDFAAAWRYQRDAGRRYI